MNTNRKKDFFFILLSITFKNRYEGQKKSINRIFVKNSSTPPQGHVSFRNLDTCFSCLISYLNIGFAKFVAGIL